jgi:hypothetical protein
MRLILLLAILLMAPTLEAAAESTADVAMKLHRALMAIDAPKLVDTVMDAIIKQAGEEIPPIVQAEMKSVLTEIVMSDEYAQAKAQSYAAIFTLEELKELLELVGTPIFEKYQSVLPALAADSTQRLNALMEANQPRIQRRLQEAWEKAEPQ